MEYRIACYVALIVALVALAQSNRPGVDYSDDYYGEPVYCE